MKILIIGLGGIGQRHARNLRTFLGSAAELLAYRVRGLSHVITPSFQVDRDHEVEKEHGIRVFDRLECALAEQPQIAFVCNPSSLHVPVTLACVRAGCDVFLEKPVSHSLDGLAEVVQAVAANHRIVMVGFQLRFHPCFKRLHEILREHEIGAPLAVRATVGEYLPGWHPYEDYREMYAARADLGGGVLVSQIHEFDYLYALFGIPRRLFSVGGHLSHLEIDVEDIASTIMEFQIDGRSFPVHLHQDYLQRPPSRSCEIIGDKGKVVMDISGVALTRYDQNGNLAESRRWEGLERNRLFTDELSHFFDCVQTRRKPVSDLNDGISSLRMALAARESLATGCVVDLTSGTLSTTPHA